MKLLCGQSARPMDGGMVHWAGEAGEAGKVGQGRGAGAGAAQSGAGQSGAGGWADICSSDCYGSKKTNPTGLLAYLGMNKAAGTSKAGAEERSFSIKIVIVMALIVVVIVIVVATFVFATAVPRSL